MKWGGDALQFVSLPQDLTLIQLLGLRGWDGSARLGPSEGQKEGSEMQRSRARLGQCLQQLLESYSSA